MKKYPQKKSTFSLFIKHKLEKRKLVSLRIPINIIFNKQISNKFANLISYINIKEGGFGLCLKLVNLNEKKKVIGVYHIYWRLSEKIFSYAKLT